MIRHRKVVPHGGQHPTVDEWYDDKTGKVVTKPLPAIHAPEELETEPDVESDGEVVQDAEPSEPTETTDAGGSDAPADGAEVPNKPTRRRKRTKAEPTDGDGVGTSETD